MQVYKHTGLGFAQDLVRGKRIKLGTFSHYREGEGERVDKEEGLYTAQATGSFIGGSPMAERMKMAGVMDVPAGTRVVMDNNIVIHGQREMLMFCTSREPNFRHAQSKGLAIVRLDLRRLAICLCQANQHLAGYEIGAVSYDKAAGDLFASEYMTNPFRKPKKFDWENEIRLLFQGVPRGAVEILNARSFRGWGEIIFVPKKCYKTSCP